MAVPKNGTALSHQPRGIRPEEEAIAAPAPKPAQLTDAKARENRVNSAVASFRQATGARTDEAGDRIISQVFHALVSPRPKDTNDGILKALAVVGEFAPRNLTEGMLATQMIAANDAALMFLQRATIPEQYPDAIDANVMRATRLMRVFNEQLEAMQKLQGKSGQQKMTVEHVHVHEGGQAVVGMIQGGVGGESENR